MSFTSSRHLAVTWLDAGVTPPRRRCAARHTPRGPSAWNAACRMVGAYPVTNQDQEASSVPFGQRYGQTMREFTADAVKVLAKGIDNVLKDRCR